MDVRQLIAEQIKARGYQLTLDTGTLSAIAKDLNTPPDEGVGVISGVAFCGWLTYADIWCAVAKHAATFGEATPSPLCSSAIRLQQLGINQTPINLDNPSNIKLLETWLSTVYGGDTDKIDALRASLFAGAKKSSWAVKNLDRAISVVEVGAAMVTLL